MYGASPQALIRQGRIGSFNGTTLGLPKVGTLAKEIMYHVVQCKMQLTNTRVESC